MASAIPSSGIQLHGAYEEAKESKSSESTAIVFKLSNDIVQDLKKASSAKEGIQFTSGSSPKLRIGGRTIDLSISPDAFRNELFASTSGTSTADLTFSSLISHRAEPKSAARKPNDDTSGSDAALAALQSSLASYEQEKKANQTNITNTLLDVPKSRFDAAKKERQEKKRQGYGNISRLGSPSLSAIGTPALGPAPTSAPASEETVKLQAMKTVVIHLLAMKSMNDDAIIRKTHIPKDDLGVILQRVAKQADGRWQLTDRAYKDLDLWKFEYPSQEDRQAAVDNAIKAFDRLRLGKDDELWQKLLPRKDRGKGIVLSRLYLGAGQVNRGLTPHYQPSPTPQAERASDSKPVSAANTPRLGASTPRPGSSKGDVMKRLLSKDPKKARAAEEAKDKKRKEREATAAASDVEGGKAAKKAKSKSSNPNVKSAEFVHSSDDASDEEGELVEAGKKQATAEQKKPMTATKPRSRAVTSGSSDSSDEPMKSAATKSTPKTNASTAKAKPSPAVKPTQAATTGKDTSQNKPSNGLSAPNSSSKSQRSPHKSESKPSVPSPLGAARPRVASDVSDKGAVGVQKGKQGADTPKGLGITNGARKRHDTVTSTDSTISKASEGKTTKHAALERPLTPATGGISAAKSTSSKAQQACGGIKRKAEDDPGQDKNAKHRKSDSSSSEAQKSHPDRAPVINGTDRTSPENSSGNDSAVSLIDSISYNQGVTMAEKFQRYYPAYTKLYDEQATKLANGEVISKKDRDSLNEMHKRLEQMKREIKAASQRE